MHFRSSVLLLFSLFLCFGAHAEEGKHILTLREALSTISRTSPEINEAIQVFESVNGELKMAETGYNPTVEAYLSGGKEITDGVDTNGVKQDLNASKASISLKQNIFNGYGTTQHVRETKARAMAAAYDVLNTANKVFLASSEAYVKVLMEKELLDTAYENVTVQAQILEQIQEKTKSGFGKISDLTSAQARLALSRANYVSQQQTLKQAIVQFHRQMGRFIKADEFAMPDQTYQLPTNADEMVEIAFMVYPAINVADYNIVSKKYGKKRAMAGYYPKIDFEMSAARNTNTGGDEGSTNIYSAMLTLNYNIYDGGMTAAEKKKKEADILKEYERGYIERRNLIETVRLAWAIKESEDAKLPFLGDYVELTRKTRDAFVEENKLGRRTLLEVLNMENEYQTSKTTLIRSRYTSVLAYFRLLQVTGVFLTEYENGLARKLGLPDLHNIDKLEDYNKLKDNRDTDAVKDYRDQCQESFIFQTSPYGCENTDGVDVGYKIPDKFEPYIKPNNGSLESLDALPAPKTVGKVTLESLDALPAPKKTNEQKNLPAKLASNVVPKIFDAGTKVQTKSMPNLTFKYNSYELTDEALAVILRIAKELRNEKGEYTLKIYGHTDNAGTPEANKELSKMRVISVHKQLMSLGIPRAVMLGLGKGDTMPVAPNDTVEGRAQNRRIEFKLIRK